MEKLKKILISIILFFKLSYAQQEKIIPLDPLMPEIAKTMSPTLQRAIENIVVKLVKETYPRLSAQEKADIDKIAAIIEKYVRAKNWNQLLQEEEQREKARYLTSNISYEDIRKQYANNPEYKKISDDIEKLENESSNLKAIWDIQRSDEFLDEFIKKNQPITITIEELSKYKNNGKKIHELFEKQKKLRNQIFDETAKQTTKTSQKFTESSDLRKMTDEIYAVIKSSPLSKRLESIGAQLMANSAFIINFYAPLFATAFEAFKEGLKNAKSIKQK